MDIGTVAFEFANIFFAHTHANKREIERKSPQMFDLHIVSLIFVLRRFPQQNADSNIFRSESQREFL
jgi:hypothetical protein